MPQYKTAKETIATRIKEAQEHISNLEGFFESLEYKDDSELSWALASDLGLIVRQLKKTKVS